MKSRLGFLALGLGLAWACGDDENPPPPGGGHPDAGESGDGGTSTGGTSSGGANSGGSAGRGGSGPGGAGSDTGGTAGTAGAGGSSGSGSGEAGAGGEPGVPPCPSDLAERPTSLTSDCDPAGEWGLPMDVAIAGNAARLVAVTPDELTMAWLSVSFIGNTYGVADRATPNESFGMGQELMVTNLVAMSPDGLRLVGISEDQSEFYELSRTARGEAFGVPEAGAFSTLNANAATNDLTFSTAFIAHDDNTLYYSLRGSADGEFPVRVSTRTGSGPWPVGTPLDACELATLGSSAREPTGISADGLTLFYFDYARGTARASWRETATGPFVWSTDLGDRNVAQPNAACSRLYFTLNTGPTYSDSN